MSWLAIESSFESCSVALGNPGAASERFLHDPRGHADNLLPWVDELLVEAGTPLAALEGIVFARGPGSFTSLRIGVGVVQGLAFGADLPVVPISSLAAVAQTALPHTTQEHILVAMDARMGEVYAALFRREGDVVVAAGEEWLASPENLPEQFVAALHSETAAVGTGFERFDALKAAAGQCGETLTDCWPRATALLQLAPAWLASHPPLTSEQAQPVYLRDKVAEIPRAT